MIAFFSNALQTRRWFCIQEGDFFGGGVGADTPRPLLPDPILGPRPPNLPNADARFLWTANNPLARLVGHFDKAAGWGAVRGGGGAWGPGGGQGSAMVGSTAVAVGFKWGTHSLRYFAVKQDLSRAALLFYLFTCQPQLLLPITRQIGFLRCCLRILYYPT